VLCFLVDCLLSIRTRLLQAHVLGWGTKLRYFCEPIDYSDTEISIQVQVNNLHIRQQQSIPPDDFLAYFFKSYSKHFAPIFHFESFPPMKPYFLIPVFWLMTLFRWGIGFEVFAVLRNGRCSFISQQTGALKPQKEPKKPFCNS